MNIPIDIWVNEPLVDADFPVQYGASFSPMLRATAQAFDDATGGDTIEKIREQVEGLVNYFEEHGEELGLKDIIPGGMNMRQVDIRTEPDGPIIFKTWTGWQREKDRWMVFVEGGLETYWEENGCDGFNPEMN